MNDEVILSTSEKHPRSSNPAGKHHGYALFAVCSYLNHSDSPNAELALQFYKPSANNSVHGGPRAIIKALRTIRQGEPITLAHVPVQEKIVIVGENHTSALQLEE
jgi:hypothetical protein